MLTPFQVRVISDEDDDDADDDVIEIEAVDSDSDVISLDVSFSLYRRRKTFRLKTKMCPGY